MSYAAKLRSYKSAQKKIPYSCVQSYRRAVILYEVNTMHYVVHVIYEKVPYSSKNVR